SLLKVSANGSIGIGTTTKSSTLYVQGTSTLPTLNVFDVTSSSGDSLLTVLNNGNVGIGVAAPTAKLDLYNGLNDSSTIGISSVVYKTSGQQIGLYVDVNIDGGGTSIG